MSQYSSKISVPMLVSGYLRRELRKRGFSQESFAEAFGVDPRTVRRWLSDGVHSLDLLVELASFFGVRLGDILSDEDDVPLKYYRRRGFPPVFL